MDSIRLRTIQRKYTGWWYMLDGARNPRMISAHSKPSWFQRLVAHLLLDWRWEEDENHPHWVKSAKDVNAVIKVCAHKEPHELTDKERTAIAIAAGAEYCASIVRGARDGFRLVFPVEITKEQGHFIVHERRTLRCTVGIHENFQL